MKTNPDKSPTTRARVIEWAREIKGPFEVADVVEALGIEMKQASSALCDLSKGGHLSKTPIACKWRKNRYQFIEKEETEDGELIPPTPCVKFQVGRLLVFPECLALVRL